MTLRPLLRLLLAVAVLAAALLPLTTMRAATDGVITGTLKPNTPDGPSVGGIEVRLFIFKNEQEQAQRTGATDAHGAFRFEGLDTASDYTYQVATLYAGLPYGTGGLKFEAGQTEQTVKVDVFDVTNDNPGFYADSVTWMLLGADPETESAFALEMIELVNPGQKAYQPKFGGGAAGGPAPMNPANLVRFGLPPGATDLTAHLGIAGDEMVQIERGFASMAVILPGAHEFMFAYRFPYKDGKVEFTKSLLYGAKKFTLLSLDGAGELTPSGQVTAGETVELRDQKYRQWGARDLEPGASIELRYSRLPQPSGLRVPVFKEQPAAAYSTLGVGAALLGLAVLLLVRARTAKQAALLPAEATALPDGDIGGYLTALASLDDRFAAGQVAPAEYEGERVALKRDLKDLLRERDLRLAPAATSGDGSHV